MNINLLIIRRAPPPIADYLHGAVRHGHVVRLRPGVRMAAERLQLAVLPRHGVVGVVGGVRCQRRAAAVHEHTTQPHANQTKKKQKKRKNQYN